jgi:organic radical activating enzyme
MQINVINPFILTFLDYPDDESHAILVYMMGCDHNCNGCQNIQFKNFEYSKNTIKLNMNSFLKKLNIFEKKYQTNKIVLSGGDPLSKYNINFTKSFLNVNLKYEICIYTGYDIEYVNKNNIDNFNYIICNPYDLNKKIKSEKTNEYFQLASTNQQIYNDKKQVISINGRINF